MASNSKSTKATSAATAPAKTGLLSKIKSKLHIFTIAKVALAAAGAKVLILDPIGDRIKTGNTWDHAKETVKTKAGEAMKSLEHNPIYEGVQSVKTSIATAGYVNDKAAYASAIAAQEGVSQPAYAAQAAQPAYTAQAVQPAQPAPVVQQQTVRDDMSAYVSGLTGGDSNSVCFE